MSSGVQVVLVRPSFAKNVGSVARAVANMGGAGLVLIDPRCAVDEAAKEGAAGAQAWLERRRVYANWDEFLATEGQGYRIALTRRVGKRRQTKSLPETLADLAIQAPESATGHSTYLIFGPEAHGLDSSDLAWVHRSASLPIPGEFKSMNLSHAVLLALHIAQGVVNPSSPHPTPPRSEPMYFPDQSIRRWLMAMGFSLERRKMSAYLTLRRLLLGNWPSERELHVLEAILHQNIRKLEELKRLKSSTALLEETTDQLP